MEFSCYQFIGPGGASRGTPTPGSWLGVGGGNYSDAGVGEKCLDCAKEKSSSLEATSQRGS